MRGEDSPLFVRPSDALGSPPHARGRLLGDAKDIKVHPDHPRMRGEDFGVARGRSIWPGSPPHARGRHLRFGDAPANPGITPACAGKTHVAERVGDPGRDHPRMRGEDFREHASPRLGRGSPPHARGRPRRSFVSFFPRRITPACAGKTIVVHST